MRVRNRKGERQMGSWLFHAGSKSICDGCLHLTWGSIIRFGKRNALGRGLLQRTKVGSGTRSHRDHGYYRFRRTRARTRPHTLSLAHIIERGRKRRPSDWGDN